MSEFKLNHYHGCVDIFMVMYGHESDGNTLCYFAHVDHALNLMHLTANFIDRNHIDANKVIIDGVDLI